MRARRGRGEGSIIQVHGPKWGCPEPVEVVNPQTGKVRKVTPKHPRCTGLWRLTVDLGVLDGKRRRVTVQRATKGDVMDERDRLVSERSSGIIPDKITVSQWMDLWLESAQLKVYTRAGSDARSGQLRYRGRGSGRGEQALPPRQVLNTRREGFGPPAPHNRGTP